MPPAASPDPQESAQRVLSAINALENCPAWAGYFLPKLDDMAVKLAEKCVTGQTLDSRETARLECLTIRSIRKLVAEERATAESVIKRQHEQPGVRSPSST